MRSRAELENLINGSTLFSIDRITDSELFVIEERRFLTDLAELMSLVRNDFKKTGYEIICTAKACVKAYRSDCGVFLNYFNVALKKTLFVEKAKEQISEMRSGLTLDRKTEQAVRQIIKYAKVCGGDIYDKKFVSNVTEVLGIPPEKVVEVVAINRDITVKSGNTLITHREGKTGELFDFIATKTGMPDETVISEDAVRMHILSIDAAFQKQQERIKPLLSKLVTARLLSALDDISLIERVISGVTFIDDELYLRYNKDGIVPAAKEIAGIFGVMEASASRTYKTFLEKIKTNY